MVVPGGWLSLMSEVPLYSIDAHDITHPARRLDGDLAHLVVGVADGVREVVDAL